MHSLLPKISVMLENGYGLFERLLETAYDNAVTCLCLVSTIRCCHWWCILSISLTTAVVTIVVYLNLHRYVELIIYSLIKPKTMPEVSTSWIRYISS